MTKPIPIEIMATHVAIVGKTGSGKTYTAKGFVEQLLQAGRRTIILDPTGVWWGLRSLQNGKASGLRIWIIGGEHGDVPLGEKDGETIARYLVEKGAHAVIDLSELLLSERHRFVEKFAAALYHANKTTLHLIIDEADEFAPQNPMPECKRMLGNIDRIVRRGRSKGFRVTMISQRPAVLNKNVLTQANTLIAMKLMSPQDRKAIDAWIQGAGDEKVGKEVMNTLGRLKRGEGWIWSPDLEILERRTFPAITTFDSSRAPDEGEVLNEPARAIALDVGELRGLLAEPDEEAEPTTAQKSRGYAAATQEQLAAEYQRGFGDGTVRGREIARLEVGGTMVAAIREFADGLLADTFAPGNNPVNNPVKTGAKSPAPRLNGTDRSATAPLAKDGRRRMLIALAQFPNGLSQKRLALLAHLALGSGTWSKYLGHLRSDGHVVGSDVLVITNNGMKQVGEFEPLPTGEGLRRYWANWLGADGARRIFETLLAAYPNSMSVHQCAAKSNLVLGSGTWSKYLGRLRGLKLVTGRSDLRASEELFV